MAARRKDGSLQVSGGWGLRMHADVDPGETDGRTPELELFAAGDKPLDAGVRLSDEHVAPQTELLVLGEQALERLAGARGVTLVARALNRKKTITEWDKTSPARETSALFAGPRPAAWEPISQAPEGLPVFTDDRLGFVLGTASDGQVRVLWLHSVQGDLFGKDRALQPAPHHLTPGLGKSSSGMWYMAGHAMKPRGRGAGHT